MSDNAPRPRQDRLRPLWDPADLDASDARFRSALADETTDAGRAEVLTQLARVELKRGLPDEAHRLLDEADRVAGEAPTVRARVLLERGRVTRHYGDVEEAKRLLEEAVDAALAANEPFIAADAAHSRALAGDIEQWTKRGLDLAEQYPGAAYWRGTLLINLGEWQWEQGDAAGALATFEAALAARERDGRNPQQLEYARYAVARSVRRLGGTGYAVAAPTLESPAVDDVISAYFDAWNEPDEAQRRRLLQQAVTPEAELVDPTGRWRGIDGFAERIGKYLSSAPGTRVVPSSGMDAHHDVVRYSWAVVGPNDETLADGLDVAERASDGRLSRISMFQGPLPPA